MNSAEFGRRLRERRESEGKTQDQVAAAAKCSRGMISQWESGTPKKIDAMALLLVARYLRTTVDYLLEGEAAVSEVGAAYGPEPRQVSEDWAWLTTDQRQQKKDEIAAIARHNRSVFEQMSLEQKRSGSVNDGG